METIDKRQMIAQHESHILFHVIGDGVDIQVLLFSFFICICMLLSHFSNLLHYKVTVIPTEIVKDDWYLNVFWFDPQF